MDIAIKRKEEQEERRGRTTQRLRDGWRERSRSTGSRGLHFHKYSTTDEEQIDLQSFHRQDTAFLTQIYSLSDRSPPKTKESEIIVVPRTSPVSQRGSDTSVEPRTSTPRSPPGGRQAGEKTSSEASSKEQEYTEAEKRDFVAVGLSQLTDSLTSMIQQYSGESSGKETIEGENAGDSLVRRQIGKFIKERLAGDEGQSSEPTTDTDKSREITQQQKKISFPEVTNTVSTVLTSNVSRRQELPLIGLPPIRSTITVSVTATVTPITVTAPITTSVTTSHINAPGQLANQIRYSGPTQIDTTNVPFVVPGTEFVGKKFFSSPYGNDRDNGRKETREEQVSITQGIDQYFPGISSSHRDIIQTTPRDPDPTDRTIAQLVQIYTKSLSTEPVSPPIPSRSSRIYGDSDKQTLTSTTGDRNILESTGGIAANTIGEQEIQTPVSRPCPATRTSPIIKEILDFPSPLTSNRFPRFDTPSTKYIPPRIELSTQNLPVTSNVRKPPLDSHEAIITHHRGPVEIEDLPEDDSDIARLVRPTPTPRNSPDKSRYTRDLIDSVHSSRPGNKTSSGEKWTQPRTSAPSRIISDEVIESEGSTYPPITTIASFSQSFMPEVYVENLQLRTDVEELKLQYEQALEKRDTDLGYMEDLLAQLQNTSADNSELIERVRETTEQLKRAQSENDRLRNQLETVGQLKGQLSQSRGETQQLQSQLQECLHIAEQHQKQRNLEVRQKISECEKLKDELIKRDRIQRESQVNPSVSIGREGQSEEILLSDRYRRSSGTTEQANMGNLTSIEDSLVKASRTERTDYSPRGTGMTSYRRERQVPTVLSIEQYSPKDSGRIRDTEQEPDYPYSGDEEEQTRIKEYYDDNQYNEDFERRERARGRAPERYQDLERGRDRSQHSDSESRSKPRGKGKKKASNLDELGKVLRRIQGDTVQPRDFHLTTFSGKVGENASAWWNKVENEFRMHKQNWIVQRGIIYRNLGGVAQVWFDSLRTEEDDPEGPLSSLKRFKEAFLKKFTAPDTQLLAEYQFGKRKQRTGESVDSYLDEMIVLGHSLGATDREQFKVLLNGLLPEIQSAVMKMKPRNIDELITDARIASASADRELNPTVAAVQAISDVKELVREIPSVVQSAVAGERARLAAMVGSAKEAEEETARVTEEGIRRMEKLLTKRLEEAPPPPKEINPEPVTPRPVRPPPPITQPTPYGIPPGVCAKCGREGHWKRECPVLNQPCYNCGSLGHFRNSCPKLTNRGRGRVPPNFRMRQPQFSTPPRGYSAPYSSYDGWYPRETPPWPSYRPGPPPPDPHVPTWSHGNVQTYGHWNQQSGPLQIEPSSVATATRANRPEN